MTSRWAEGMLSLPTPESFIAALGGFPSRVSLHLVEKDVTHEPDHTRTLIEYTSVGDTRVSAFLLVPRSPERRMPAAVAIHQDHSLDRPDRYDIGKSEPAGVVGDPELAYGVELCQRGYVVLCPDRIGFEARKGQGTIDRYDGPALQASLFEMHRAVDVLCSLPTVDMNRLGVLGHSAGGWLATLLIYTDERIRACAASCGTWLWKWGLKPIAGDLEGLSVPAPPSPALLDWGDQDDVIAGIAPKPYLHVRSDPWPSTRNDDLVTKARHQYASFGVPERLDWVTYDGGHVFRRDMRQRSYAWFDQWFRVVPAGERGSIREIG